MTYQEAVRYIEKIPKFTKKHSLKHTKEFLKRLGKPGMDRKLIHVAGTNGKGSVCAYLQAILMAEGKRVGFFTSPHLVSVNERIRVDNVPIDDAWFVEVFNEVLEVSVQMEEEGWGHPSYFEFLFGMGMKAFAGTDVEYIILETGLGGRLDATNSIERPKLTIITSISLDHTELLGDTIEKIAAEKAGIIKRGVPVFFDGSAAAASEVIRRIAFENDAPCREISNHAYEIQEVTRKYIAFSRVNAYDKDVIIHVPMCGCYQAMNAQIALCAAEHLLSGEQKLHEERWQEAIASLRWEGRMERVAPHLVVDGAHNKGAIEAFVESMKALGESSGSVILFSAVRDKKYEQMIECLCSRLDVKAYVVTEVDDARRVPARELAQVFRRYTEKKVVCEAGLLEAIRAAEAQREGDGDVYCLGSLYLVGMIKTALCDLCK
ncbi:folylpolyglutamate synthase [Lachnospiraceae bacterium]|nr:folylpolyglutamate synthase [Lachnospiraceae bacterium]